MFSVFITRKVKYFKIFFPDIGVYDSLFIYYSTLRCVFQMFFFLPLSSFLKWLIKNASSPNVWFNSILNTGNNKLMSVCSLFCFCFSSGINKQIAVDAAYFPIISSADPRAVGLPQDPHGNTMLSCLSSAFLCPLSDAASHSEATLPEPGTRCTLGQ